MEANNGKKIRQMMAEKGVKVVHIARCFGISLPYASQVVHGHRKPERIRTAISRIVNVPVDELWPDDN